MRISNTIVGGTNQAITSRRCSPQDSHRFVRPLLRFATWHQSLTRRREQGIVCASASQHQECCSADIRQWLAFTQVVVPVMKAPDALRIAAWNSVSLCLDVNIGHQHSRTAVANCRHNPLKNLHTRTLFLENFHAQFRRQLTLGRYKTRRYCRPRN